MMGADGGSLRKKTPSRPSVLPDRPMRRTRSSVEIQRYAEDDDEDFSDVFGPEGSNVAKPESDLGSEDGGLMLLSKVSSNSWLGDDEDEDDPTPPEGGPERPSDGQHDAEVVRLDSFRKQ